MTKLETDHYSKWLETLSDEDFENERYTVMHEAELIGMSNDEAIDKANALDVEAYNRPRESGFQSPGLRNA
jgi:hypothetical protein